MTTSTQNKGDSRAADRRFFERLPQRSVLRVVNPKNPSTDQFAILVDISRGGARLEVGQPFEHGVLVTLYLPKTQFGPPRKMNARVIWSGQSTESVGWHQIGCQFNQ
ncbi:MAG: PilZ domain-containing protein [Planctomycetes bacterium]|nr:PilZ domain-containing protein [Planctomycetota bacterium]